MDVGISTRAWTISEHKNIELTWHATG